MTEPHLNLEPYELPIDRQSDSHEMDGKPFFVEANCFGEKRTFVGRSINDDGYCNVLFFGLPDEPERGHFVCIGSDKNDSQPMYVYGEEETTLIESIENQRWARHFVLNKAFELADQHNAVYSIALCSTGFGHITHLRQNFANFQWSQPCAKDLWALPYEELLKQFLKAKNSSEKIDFAFRWADMSEVDNFDLAYPLNRGSYAEWDQVLTWGVLALIDWNDTEQFRLGSVNRQEKEDPQEEDSFHGLARWLTDYFCPTRNEELCDLHFHVKKWADWVRDSLPFKRYIQRPTHHERLEAKLQLRDWLADKATPEEIERLLGKE